MLSDAHSERYADMPPAVIAWLDYSEADQRRAREIIRLFSQRDSRDELGLGSIRDALSDTLFPGTSVLLTRARYFLFLPWLYREGADGGRQGSQLASWVDGQERRLIGKLSKGGDSAGLIGGVVGEQVQNLPSTIYLEQPATLWHPQARGVANSSWEGARCFAVVGRRERVGRTPRHNLGPLNAGAAR